MGLLDRIAHSNGDAERTIAALRLMNEQLKRELNRRYGQLDRLSLVVSHYQAGQDLERQGCLPEAIKQYELADTLYQVEILVEDSPEEYKQIHCDILDRLSQFYLEQKQFTQCLDTCRQRLAYDNCHEETHRRLMLCYFSQGQHSLAIRQYRLCAELLAREFEVLPTSATVQLYHEIQRNEVYFKLGRTSAESTLPESDNWPPLQQPIQLAPAVAGI
jgi:tetratricopeptide (TPR) repeat protein